MQVPKAVSGLIASFQKLPGVGPKSAQRLTYYLLHVPQGELDDFARNVENLKKDTTTCSICKNIGETNPCEICSDDKRDKQSILVVEQPLDVLAFERTGRYKGLYHVLHGAINPLDNIGPDEIFIQSLLNRLVDSKPPDEVIIATNPTMEGEATAMYLTKKIKETLTNGNTVTITRIGMGIPTGADLEYADDVTLRESLEGRRVL